MFSSKNWVTEKLLGVMNFQMATTGKYRVKGKIRIYEYLKGWNDGLDLRLYIMTSLTQM